MRTQPPRALDEYVPLSDHYAWLREAYAEGASPRTTRAVYPELEPGTWMLDDLHRGAYGRGIEELVEFQPRDLEPKEFSWDDPKAELRHEGKWHDVERYADWLRAGGSPPPISVVQTDRGDLRVTDGHRRLAAADLAGKPVRAWVSWVAPHPEGLCEAHSGRPIGVGLTHELAHGGAGLKRRLMR